MKKMIAQKRFLFSGKLLNKGDEFTVNNENEAREYEQAGLAEYQTKDVKARKADTEFASEMTPNANMTMDSTMNAQKMSNQANSTLSENAFNAEFSQELGTQAHQETTQAQAKKTNRKSE